ncbi:MAG: hypothetical protein IGS49_15635 [Chlorogloeopsis fritschii C42_A2020_084]|uniref:hypothetical protein n=1 Tax=Chlorogloeopsis fritschii TaxID=1124 RepID=UPI0019EC1434|nr:hypothetical protein [Chlorogloeopsis fritschii]MBF2006856.1 hypothetical protein [Chlorogloeopsis fritschii C42_A2020_084]
MRSHQPPCRIQAPGNKPKIIEEYIGRVSTQTEAVSVVVMRSPAVAFDRMDLVKFLALTRMSPPPLARTFTTYQQQKTPA